MECPYIQRPIDKTFNRPINYSDFGGEDYIFFDHDDSCGHITRVQFCKFIGKKKDVFQCFNEAEWKACLHYRLHVARQAHEPDAEQQSQTESGREVRRG